MQSKLAQTLFLSIIFTLSSLLSFGQSAGPWNFIDEAEVVQRGQRLIQATDYRVARLDYRAMETMLASAPTERSGYQASEAVFIDLPMPDGSYLTFEVVYSPIYESGFQQKFPSIRTYAGAAVGHRGVFVRLDMTPSGFHAMVMRAGESTLFIDPLTFGGGDIEHYMVYDKANFMTSKVMDCAVESVKDAPSDFIAPSLRTPFANCELKEYRLALAATGEYTAFHGGTVVAAAAAQVTSMNRVNGVYERDLGVRMNLVANNDLLIYTDGTTDPYTNANGSAMLSENQTTCDNVIGTANYDIGHVYSTGGGGVAYLNSPCGSSKAGGVTGQGSPVGDPFDIDYVAHEMGHQFGGNHTQNNNCNRSSASVECGSGSSIMGYAGICAPNVQNNSNDHFNGWNLVEMGVFLNGSGSTCGTVTAVSNTNPSITSVPSSLTLPVSTPFELTAVVVDAESDPLTYCWEQQDPATATQPPVSTNTGGPSFRSLSPTSSPTRYFPNLVDLTSGVTPTWEVLPSVSRSMNFKVTVRDNASPAGCPEYDEVALTFNSTAGPFVVQTPSTSGILWSGQTQETVTWDVASTDLAPVSAATVDILLSLDGGLTYPTVLASGVTNDGSHTITVPNTPSNTARVMVHASNNVFFDISDNDFEIESGLANDYTLTVTNATESICSPSDASFNINVGQVGTYTDAVNLSISSLPGSATSSFSTNPVTTPGTSVLTIANTASITPGSYPITLSGNSTTGVKTVDLTLIVSESPLGPVTLLSPAASATDVGVPTDFSWTPLGGDGVQYTVEIASDAAFGSVVDNSGNLNVNSYTSSVLGANTTYYWRVLASNNCASAGYSSVFSFTTANCVTLASTDVPVTIPLAIATVTSTITVPNTGSILDINVRNLAGTHTWLGDLTFTLTSPTNTTVTLLAELCSGEDHFDIEFDDQAAPGTPPCPFDDGGAYQPSGSLADFIGEDAQGTWTLSISDSHPADGGELQSWGLEFCLGPPPSCPSPTGLTATGITDTNATLSWTDNGSATAWDIEIGPTSFIPTGTPTHDNVSQPYTWTQGVSYTMYDYYVRADCGVNDQSIWTGPFTFRTSLPPITGVSCSPGDESYYAFTEEFDAIGDWTGNVFAPGPNGTWELPGDASSSGTGPASAHSGANYTNYESSASSSTTADLISPAIDLSESTGEVELSFYLHAFGQAMGALDVGVSTNVGGPYTSVFDISGELQITETAPWQPVGIDLDSYAGQTIYIRFRHQGTGTGFTGDMSLDLVQVESCRSTSSCATPSMVQAENVTATAADLSWTDNAGATQWEIEWGASGFGQGNGTIISPVNANPYALSGLAENNDFDFYVRAVCGAGSESFWAGPYTFSTLNGSPTPCNNGFAGIYPCDNYDLMAQIPITDLGGGATTEANDIWGWTDPLDGKEYAIMGLTTGTVFIDISDALNPIYLGELPTHTSASIWRDVKVYQNHAFIVSEASGHGMQVFDLTHLRTVASPPQTFTADAHYAGFSNCHNIVINEATGYAYAVGTDQNSGGLHIVNIQNPTSPVIAGGFAADGYTHDAQSVVYAGPDSDYTGDEIVFASNEDTFTIVDLSDKTDPTQISRTGYAGSSYAHQGWLTEDHEYFLMNDELDEQNNSHNTRTYIWNVQDLDVPVFMGYFESSIAAIDHNNYSKGDSLYQANYRGGFRVLDLTSVSTGSLTEVGYFDVYPSSNSASFNGAWSVYPYFGSENIIISSIEDGLFIVKASPQCNITALTDAGNQSLCDPVTNTYSNDVTVTYDLAPSSGTLNVNGQSFAITSSPQTVTLTGLTADGLPVDVSASFSVEPACSSSATALFTAPADCTPIPCSIDMVIDGGNQTICDPLTNTYSHDVTVSYTSAPSTGSLDVNGQSFPITSSPQTVTLSGLTADGLPVDVSAGFSDDPLCVAFEASLFTAPVDCTPIPCSIDMVIDGGNQTICDPLTNTYSHDVTVSYTSAPSTGSLDVNGQSFPIASSPQTVTLTGLTADGLPVDVSAGFSDDPLCVAFEASLFTAPVDCTPIPCSIDMVIDGGNQTVCDPLTNTYSHDVTVSYTSAPSTGSLDVNGQSFPITSSPQTVTLTGMTADGLPIDVSASFSDDPLCVAFEASLFTAPVDCTPTGLVNDECLNAIEITPSLHGDLSWETYSMVGATQTSPACVGDADDDVWFSFVAASSNDFIVAQSVGSDFDAIIEVLDGCSGMSLGCYNNYSSGAIERVIPGGLTVGQSYVFRVYSQESTVQASQAVRVQVKTFASGSIQSQYCGQTDYIYEDNFSAENQVSQELYPNPNIVATAYGVQFEDMPSAFMSSATQLGVSGYDFSFLDVPGLQTGQSYQVYARHQLQIAANGSVGFYWSDYGAPCTMGLQELTGSLSNDECTGATFITTSLFGNSSWETHSMAGATESSVGCVGDADDDVWFTFIAGSSNDYIIAQSVGTAFDAVVEVYSACGGQSLGCYNNYGSGAIERVLPGNLVAGQAYMFRVYSAESAPSVGAAVRVQVKTYAMGMIQAQYCGVLDFELDDNFSPERQDLQELYSNPNIVASGYGVQFEDNGSAFVTSHSQTGAGAADFTLASVQGVSEGNEYSVSARHQLQIIANGSVGFYWSDYGPACTMGLSGTSVGLQNDECAGAIDIVPSLFGVLSWEVFSKAQATMSLPGCTGSADDDVWFSFTAGSANDYIIAQSVGAGFDAVIEVFDGCDGQSLGCFNNYGVGAIERVIPGGLQAGQQYVFRVYSAESGPTNSIFRVQVKTFASGMIRSEYCGVTDYSIGDQFSPQRQDLLDLYPNPNIVVTGYDVSLENTINSAVSTLVQTGAGQEVFSFADFSGMAWGLQFDATVRHSLQIIANGSVGHYWSDYGESCVLGLDLPIADRPSMAFTTDSDMDLYPNPIQSGDQVYLSYDRAEINATNMTVSLSDMLGNTLFVRNYPQQGTAVRLVLPLEDLPAGMYFISMQIDGQLKSTRIVIE